MPEEAIKPYQGPPPTPENFTTAFPQMEATVKKGVNNLDEESQANLNALLAQMRSTPPKPATVINLHPWPLSFGYGNRLLRAITIPACPPGQLVAYSYIRVWRKDWEYNENGTLKFKAITPIQIAAEFIREFSNKDNDGGGVIIYEGEHNPDKVETVEVYDAMGRAQTTSRNSFEYDEENNRVPVIAYDPIRKSFKDVLKEAIAVRNQVYFRKVQAADHDYKLPDGRGKRNITDKHRLMAEVLYAEGVITSLPQWDLGSRLDEGLEEGNCPACASPRRAAAFRCGNCSHILNAYEAYKAGAIEYGHVSMDTMTSDEWEEVEQIKVERDEARNTAMSKRSEAKGKGGRVPKQGDAKQ